MLARHSRPKLRKRCCATAVLFSAGCALDLTDASVSTDGSTDPAAIQAGLAIGTAEVVTPNNCTCDSEPGIVCSCTGLLIKGCGYADAAVEAYVRVPDGRVSRGTVLLGTGENGTSLYNGSVVERLSADAGFVTVVRRWRSSWMSHAEGPDAAACRYATLLDWVARQPWAAEGPVCATGNSSGAAEVAYALTHYGAESLLDYALLTSGPPLSRIEVGCFGSVDPSVWDADCGELFDSIAVCTTGEAPRLCTYSPSNAQLVDKAYVDNPCTDGTGDAVTRARLRSDSIVPQAGSDYDYPNTGVEFLFGARDCSEAVPLGLLYANKLVQPPNISRVPGGRHQLFDTLNGQDAIVAAIENGCFERSE